MVGDLVETLKGYDSETLVGKSLDEFDYEGFVHIEYKGEKSDGHIFAISYIPNEYKDNLNAEIIEKYYCQDWILPNNL